MNAYGVNEVNGLIDPKAYHDNFNPEYTVPWTDPNLAKITRLRLLTEPGFPYLDVSYVHGVMKDGTQVWVQVPFFHLPRKGASRAIVEAAKADGVHAKRLGIFDGAISILFG